jgi:mercuric ion transport protein
MHHEPMTIKDDHSPFDARRGQRLMAVGSLLGALAASSCCILPLVLFSLGVTGAWIGNLTQLAPYHSYIVAATLAFLGYGYWLVFRSSQADCTGGEACAKPLPNRLVRIGLIVATALVMAALAFDFLAPVLLTS